MMRSIGLVIAGALGAGAVLPGFAAIPLSGKDIAARFGAGAVIKGTSIPGGTPYELQLATDGTATMKVLKGDRPSRSGTWHVSDKGYCATWNGSAERCFTVVKNGKAYDLLDSTGQVVGRWTRT
jgi:hypothetical protein